MTAPFLEGVYQAERRIPSFVIRSSCWNSILPSLSVFPGGIMRGGCKALLTSAKPSAIINIANAAITLIVTVRTLFTCLFPFQIFIDGFDKYLCFGQSHFCLRMIYLPNLSVVACLAFIESVMKRAGKFFWKYFFLDEFFVKEGNCMSML